MKRALFTLLLAVTALVPLSASNALAAKPTKSDVVLTITAGVDWIGFYHFFTAEGAVEDFGEVTTYLATDDAGEPLGWVRVLEGEQGTIEVLDFGYEVLSGHYWGRPCSSAGPRERNYTEKREGGYVIINGSGTYADLVGAGTYHQTFDETFDCQPFGPIVSQQWVTELGGSLLP